MVIRNPQELEAKKEKMFIEKIDNKPAHWIAATLALHGNR
jgi:hypothetical protein